MFQQKDRENILEDIATHIHKVIKWRNVAQKSTLIKDSLQSVDYSAKIIYT